VVIVLNTIEGQLVTPMLIGARMRMSALGIFVAIAFGAWLWGRGRGADRHADADRGERLRHPRAVAPARGHRVIPSSDPKESEYEHDDDHGADDPDDVIHDVLLFDFEPPVGVVRRFSLEPAPEAGWSGRW
jgi:hypothetical protein